MSAPVRPSVVLLSSPRDPDAVSLVAAAARLCYRPDTITKLVEERLERSEEERLFSHVVEVHHTSCLRHAVLVFGIEGVSRSFSHQFVRHTVGCSVEQQSQHYITEKPELHIPHVSLNRMPGGVPGTQVANRYEDAVEFAKGAYDDMVAAGLPNYEARQVLPNGVETRLIWSANLDAILHFVEVRACRVNTPEILDVAVKVRNIVARLIPQLECWLGPTCYTRGVCYEGRRRFLKDCRLPWAPTVLWKKEFPHGRVMMVSAKGWWYADLMYQHWRGKEPGASVATPNPYSSMPKDEK